MGTLFVGAEAGANLLRYQQGDRTVGEAESVAAADQLLVAIAGERLLLGAVERRARARTLGLSECFLVATQTALPFYQRLGYVKSCSR